MDLSRLAAVQKRIVFWTEFLERDDIYPETKKRITSSIEELKRIVTRAWDKEVISPEDQKKMLDLEKDLEQFNEEARMRGKGEAIWT